MMNNPDEHKNYHAAMDEADKISGGVDGENAYIVHDDSHREYRAVRASQFKATMGAIIQIIFKPRAKGS